MDKFGIFKLLNSLFNFYQEKSSADSDQPSNKPQPTQAPPSTENKPVQASQQPPAPLQDKMLNIINNHEKIVRRVKGKND